MSSIYITSYNILAPQNIDNILFRSYEPIYLSVEYRWDLLHNQLLNKVRQNSIICLQEVSSEWANLIYPFFKRYNYFCLDNPYTDDSMDMSLVTAIPSTYALLNSEYNDTRSLLKKINVKKDINLDDRVEYGCFERCSKFIRKCFRVNPYINDLNSHERKDMNYKKWKLAQRQPSKYIFVKLEDANGRQFCVANYHMPSKQKETLILASHTFMLIQKLNEFSLGAPFILAGDFSFTPDSLIYDKICHGYVCDFHELINIKKLQEEWDMWIPFKLISAYYDFFHKEPNFTRVTTTDKDNNIYETVDYIFSSPDLTLVGITNVPLCLPSKAFTYPGKNNPSNHVMISALFNFVR